MQKFQFHSIGDEAYCYFIHHNSPSSSSPHPTKFILFGSQRQKKTPTTQNYAKYRPSESGWRTGVTEYPAAYLFYSALQQTKRRWPLRLGSWMALKWVANKGVRCSGGWSYTNVLRMYVGCNLNDDKDYAVVVVFRSDRNGWILETT